MGQPEPGRRLRLGAGVSPDGRTVFVTGPAFEPGSGSGPRPFTAVAFGAATGRYTVIAYRA